MSKVYYYLMNANEHFRTIPSWHLQSQCSPLNPSWQIQENFSSESDLVHTPPFLQGFGWQGLGSAKKVKIQVEKRKKTKSYDAFYKNKLIKANQCSFDSPENIIYFCVMYSVQ